MVGIQYLHDYAHNPLLGKNGPASTILSFSKGLGLGCGFLVRSFHMIPLLCAHMCSRVVHLVTLIWLCESKRYMYILYLATCVLAGPRNFVSSLHTHCLCLKNNLCLTYLGISIATERSLGLSTWVWSRYNSSISKQEKLKCSS